MFERRVTGNFDWTLFGLAYAIALIGVVNLFSASPPDAARQVQWLVAGTMVLAAFAFVDYHTVARLAYPVYAAVLLMLVAVVFVGRSGGGAQRWLPVGPVAVQPSEFAKLAVILVLARWFSQKERGREPLGLADLIVPGLLAAVPTVMVVKQPDLGTALIIFFVFCAMVAIHGMRLKALALIAGTGLAASPLVWQRLKPYQRNRLLTFLDPEADPQGTGYQWGLNIALRAKDRLGALLAYGITAYLFLHVSVNIGMVTGVLPVVGVPLLLMSYGGSSVFTTLACIGLLLNVSMRRYMF